MLNLSEYERKLNGDGQMKYWEREKKILELLQTQEAVSMAEVCALTGASVATIRRDFDTLQEKGLAERTRGALRRKPRERKRYVNGTEIIDEIDREKYRIAQEAAAQVRTGDSIFIGAGKTCNILASLLSSMERLTVVTTSVTAVLELAECSGISVTLLGGDIHTGKHYIETLEPDIGHALRNYYFDKVFLTAEGVDLERGYTVQDKNRTGLYTQLSRVTRRLYLLLDSAKFGRKAFASVYPMDKTCRVISTQKMPAAFAAFYAMHGIPVTLLPME